MFARVLAALFLVSVTQTGLAHAGGQGGPRVLVMGDSLFAMHKLAGGSDGARLRAALGAHLVDASIGGARYLYRLPISGALGMNIAKQYHGGDWDWVVLAGGGND